MSDLAPPTATQATKRSVGARAGRAFIFLAAALVLVATLYPMDGPAGGSRNICLICGERALADAIVNVILFIPLGAAVALTGRSTLSALALGSALSCGVELAQISLIPGRDASVSDLILNTVGAVTGVAILRTAPWWLGKDRLRASRLSLASASIASAIVSVTGLFFVPHFPGGAYVVMWTPDLRHLARYDARVRSVTLDGQQLPPNQLEERSRLREALEAGAPIRVDAVAASATPRQAAMLAIYDTLKREVLLLGPDRHDLVFRVRMRSASAWLDQPEIRIAGGWGEIEPGSEITVTVGRSGNAYCVGFGFQPPCIHGFTAGMGWTLLLRMEYWPAWLQSALTWMWLGVLGFPVGFWARLRWESVTGLAVLAATFLVLPRWVGLLPTPAPQLLGALAGVALGVAVARTAALTRGDHPRNTR